MPSSDNDSILCVINRIAALVAAKAPWKLSRYDSFSMLLIIFIKISPTSDCPTISDSWYDRAAVLLMSTLAGSQYSSSNHLCSFSLSHSDSWQTVAYKVI
jgi:hypothetical protein